MEPSRRDVFRQRAWPLLLLGLFLVLLKLLAWRATPRDLDFLLAPAVSVARCLTGAGFAFSDEAGYVHDSGRIAVTTDCSGIKLWGAAAAIAIGLCFLRRPRPFRADAVILFLICLAAAWLAAVAINGLRIGAGLTAYLELPPETPAPAARSLHVRQGLLIELAGLACYAGLIFLFTRKAVSHP